MPAMNNARFRVVVLHKATAPIIWGALYDKGNGKNTNRMIVCFAWQSSSNLRNISNPMIRKK
jgi:hypothetical protein